MVGWGTADFFAASLLKKKFTGESLYFWIQILGILPALVLSIFFFSVPAFSFLLLGFICFSAFLTLIEYVFMYKAFSIGKVALVSPIAASYPLLTVALSTIFLRESLTYYQILAIFCIFFGIIFITLDLKEIRRLKIGYSTEGLVFAFISMGASGLLFALLGYLVKEMGWFTPILVMKILVALYLLPYLVLRKEKLSINSKGIFGVVVLIALLEMFAYLFYGLGAEVFLNSIVVPISATYPLVTILLARAVLKEKLMAIQYMGIFSVLAGIFIVTVT